LLPKTMLTTCPYHSRPLYITSISLYTITYQTSHNHVYRKLFLQERKNRTEPPATSNCKPQVESKKKRRKKKNMDTNYANRLFATAPTVARSPAQHTATTSSSELPTTRSRAHRQRHSKPLIRETKSRIIIARTVVRSLKSFTEY
jgi:hypothetical protein